jgi:hypothetical protein
MWTIVSTWENLHNQICQSIGQRIYNHFGFKRYLMVGYFTIFLVSLRHYDTNFQYSFVDLFKWSQMTMKEGIENHPLAN